MVRPWFIEILIIMASSSGIMQKMIFFLMTMILSSTSTSSTGQVDAFQLPIIIQHKISADFHSSTVQLSSIRRSCYFSPTITCATTSTMLFSQQQDQQQQQQKEKDQRSQPSQLRRYVRPVLTAKPNPPKLRVNGQGDGKNNKKESPPRERSTITTSTMFRPSVLMTRNRNTIVDDPSLAPVTIAAATETTKPSSLSSTATSNAKKKEEGEILPDTRQVNNTPETTIVEENQKKKTSRTQEDKNHNQKQEQHNETSKSSDGSDNDDNEIDSTIPDEINLLLPPKNMTLKGVEKEEPAAAGKEGQTEVGTSRIISDNSNGPVTVTDWKEKAITLEQKLRQFQQQTMIIKKTNSEPKNDIDSRRKYDVKSVNESESASIKKISKQENDKLEAIQSMIQKRKQQQIELENIEANLLHKTMEVKKKKEEFLLLQSSYNQQRQKHHQQIRDEEDEDFASNDMTVERRFNSINNKSNNVKKTSSTKIEESIPYLSPKEYRSLSQQEKKELKEKRADVSPSHRMKDDTNNDDDTIGDDRGENNMVHPILGPVIVDLGYKRIHLVSSGRLGNIPIWKRQRTYRNDRARRMAVDKAKQMDLGFPGIICLYEDVTGNLSILDGQHRVGMLQALREERNKLISKKGQIEKDDQNENNNVTTFSSEKLWEEQEEYFKNVLVEVYSESSSTENTNANLTNVAQSGNYAEQIFSEINKAEPLALIDIPGVASRSEHKIITEAVMVLRRRYPEMFSPSQRCRTPNVNIDNLRNSIFGANVLQRQKNKLTTGKKLFDWLIIQNAALGEIYERDSTNQEYLPANAWEKASRNAFYLGLESSWLYK